MHKLAQITVAEVLVLLNEHNLLLESQFSSSSHRFDQIAYNSKLVTDNCLFFCKGNFKPAYLDDAQKNGATAYMSEKAYRNAAIPGFIVTNIQKAMSLVSAAFFGFPQDKLPTIAYTGTKGKTTSAYFTKAILDQTYDRRVALSSTINTVVGLTSKDVVKSNLTTPESLDLFTNMHQAVENGMSHLVMEVSSQAYKKNRVYGLHYDVGVFLNISPDHIGRNEHPTFADYLHCKEQLLVNSNICILNADGTHLTDIFYAAKTTTQPENIFIYGRASKNQETDFPVDIEYRSLADSLTENQIQITAKTEKAKALKIDGVYKIGIPGDYNEGNAVAAAITSALMGAKPTEIEYGLANTTVPGRMEIYQTKTHGTVYVDYAHNYGSLHSVLDFLKKQAPTGKVTVITGSTGDKGIDRREGLGKAIDESADQAYLTTDDPATEDPKQIAKEIADHIDTSRVATTYIPDRKTAITKAVTESQKGDLVVVAGKGHDPYQKINGKNVPYEGDAAIVKNLVKGL
ncbi:UDP-N-acetylmuramoyl-L-alanyl-D-glutamate--2,6-diaminopimelate ligase [Lentilactobacillus otakiensis DSM 19908 = JCM 15040]|uniref:UDP-N-acetylmuramoyl-L-alanyl-D-glutamate--L-lysine ligase n=1 Tax=Lentilactobacillus otakiensis DSM 19908 = JCM 15040 TaxID=1423780 RepID=S4NI16_9LACO|nr:UDP-N-acetylmuramoyl-L-alanyl-D-glutamate--2,6-diaminopimelate ligase [Lentilactobacillus otakiensis DSM 19908 = JCM 15040]GAD15656.1 UDP-N-acetylmuramoylalanyl-D-glutamate--2,6-diaminopimelate ligase [Lentilactobacillus otakiensis DSM 19908 = JCM 15040]